MRISRAAGVLAVIGVMVFVAAVIVSAATFEDGAYSPANCFVTELGLYTQGYFTVSSAFYFNAGLIAFGLLTVFFMVVHGIRRNTRLDTASSFFGVAAGVLAAALGVFTLNFKQYHFILLAAFSFSVFLFCALHLIAELRSDERAGFAGCIVACFTGMASLIFGGYVLIGGMKDVLSQDAGLVGRVGILPFALVQWLFFLLLLALIIILAVDMLLGGEFEGYDEDDTYIRAKRTSQAGRSKRGGIEI